MTDREKQQIVVYRQEGYSYTSISKMMDLSINSIKTFCKRHGLGGVTGYSGLAPAGVHCCENCGKEVVQNAGRKLKRFCSNKCRNAWWNAHQEQVNRKANYAYICPHCKKTFVVYGNANRKYCSHECYIDDRFGGAK